MKKWEKPRVKKLALNYTQEEGIQPLWFWESDLYCSKCCAKYVPYFAFKGYVLEGNKLINAKRENDTWNCGKTKWNSGEDCSGVLQSSQQCS